MAKPNCEKCIHKAVCDNYEQWIGDITGFENIRAEKCPYFQEVGWVSVEKSMPQENTSILIYENGDIAVSAFIEKEFLEYSDTGFPVLLRRPTHWMPLPEPPKEG